MRTNDTTIFIAGAGHSGSTLLGLLLGSHPDAFYIGEGAKTRFLGDARKPEHKRVCKLCGPDCEVWGDFAVAPSPDLYEQVSRRTGRRRIIDSTKNLEWLAQQVSSVRRHGGQPALIFLVRDGRAVINSRVRKYPDRAPEELIRSWMERMVQTEMFFQAFVGPKCRVRYEQLATDPEGTLSTACAALGIPYESGMLDFTRGPHHVLGGNNGTQWQVARTMSSSFVKLGARTRPYYADHPKGIVLDLRWVDELSAEVLALFETIAGAQNADLAWQPEREAS